MLRPALLQDLARTVQIESEFSKLPLPLSYLRTLVRCPGVQAVAIYRLGSWALLQPWWARLVLDPLYFILQFLMQVLWAIDISRYARIGPGFYIGHFSGIFVHTEAVLGARCSISQNISIGVGGSGAQRGSPVIGDDVHIAPGARVFGRIRIGNNVKIGPNAVVHKDIPDDAVVMLDARFRVTQPSEKSRLAA
jgi:serine O-acetyltransferase